MPSWWIAGLGNPGPEYDRTRHNAGFWALDRLADAWGAPRWRAQRRVQALLSEARLPGSGEPVCLIKPTTFMNDSGRALAVLAQKSGLTADRLLVVHDDLDLENGSVRLKQGGGTGGHNGLKSLVAHVGPEFGRVRIGIGHPPTPGEDAVLRWVLGAPPPSARRDLEEAVERAAAAVEAVLREGWEAAMNRYNRR